MKGLFDDEGRSAPYQPHSETSKAAAASIIPHLNPMQARVLEALTWAGEAGMTDEEGIDHTAMNPSTWRPRRVELRNVGLIYSDSRRKTKSGRPADVWKAKTI